MDRDEVFFVLAAAFGGPLFWVATAVFPVKHYASEGEAWRSLWRPLLPVTVALSLLAGWAARAPEALQRIGSLRVILACVVLLIWLRALIRLVVRHRASYQGHAYVTGLLQPVVHLSDALREVLAPDEVEAVLAHENAHAAHWDPLRIACARFATDLQWPVPSARSRLNLWLESLESARDAEAVARFGGDPLALASALVKAARLPSVPSLFGASLVSDGQALRNRIHRLVQCKLHTDQDFAPTKVMHVCLAIALLMFSMGYLWGEVLVSPFVGAP